MAKSYLQLNDTIATFVDEHNSLVNKVGDLANLATTGDSDLIQAINEIHNSDSDNRSLIDSADTKLSSVQLVADSAQSRIDGLITERTAFPSNFIPDADGTRNLGADATRWNSTYHDYARVTNNIYVGNGSAASPAYAFEGDSNTGLYRSAADELSISTGGVERMRIDNSGNVGIGTSSPGEFVQIEKSQNEPTEVKVVNASTGTAAQARITLGNSGTNFSGFGFNGESFTTSGVFRQDGTYLYGNGDGGLTLVTGAAQPLYFATWNAERMRITSNGNVGINTVSPSSKLDINGDVTITDKIIHSGDTNTSIRFPANDTFTVETAGSERMRIDTSNVSVASNFIPDADGTRNLGADATRWNSTYHDYIRVTNNIHTGDGSAATPAYAFEDDSNTGLYQRTGDELNIATGGSERLRISAEPRAETSGSTIDTSLTQWGTFSTLESEQFIAQSTGVLITGDVIFYNAGIAMYVYSRVKLIVTGGADVAVGSTQIDGLGTSAPFDYVSQSPSLAVTGLTPGGDYTVIIEVAKGNAAACTAQGLVNYVHG